jgi:hypothetical protein
MKYFAILLIVAALSGCAVVSKQYYYVPSVTHQTIKNHYGRSDYKMVYSKVKVTNKADDSIGSIITSNGFGHPLFMGPLIFPVIPVGGFFIKITSRFQIDVEVLSSKGYFMSLAIDSNDYKRVRDSLNALKVRTAASLNGSNCYMIVNDTSKVPLHTREFFMGNNAGHAYRLTADVKFRKVKTMKLVTGNNLLDSTLKNITFKRKSRIVFNLIGPGY